MEVIAVYGAKCSDCGHELSVEEFVAADRMFPEWPISCSEELVRAELIHPVISPWNGCGGRLLIQDPVHMNSNICIADYPVMRGDYPK